MRGLVSAVTSPVRVSPEVVDPALGGARRAPREADVRGGLHCRRQIASVLLTVVGTVAARSSQHYCRQRPLLRQHDRSGRHGTAARRDRHHTRDDVVSASARGDGVRMVAAAPQPAGRQALGDPADGRAPPPGPRSRRCRVRVGATPTAPSLPPTTATTSPSRHLAIAAGTKRRGEHDGHGASPIGARSSATVVSSRAARRARRTVGLRGATARRLATYNGSWPARVPRC